MKTLTGLGEQLGEDRSCMVLPPAKQKRWSWSFYGCASSGAALLIELCFAVRAAGLKGEGKIQISAGETPQRYSRHLPSGLSLRVLMAAPIQPSAESAGGFPGDLRGLWNKHCLTLHLIFSPFIFWIEFRGGELRLFTLAAKASEGAPLSLQSAPGRVWRCRERPPGSLAITSKAWKAFLVVSNFHLPSIFLVSSCSAFIHLQGIAPQ